jgi:hypothetical protein
MPTFETLPVQRRYFYRLWAQKGFDPKQRDDCLALAGYKESVIRSHGSKIAKSVNFLIQKEMLRQGLTPTRLVAVHAKNLKAMSPAHPLMPDVAQRNAALRMAYELYDAFPSKKFEIDKREMIVNISVDTLRDVEEATGQDIVSEIPEESFIDVEAEEVSDEPIDEQGDEGRQV